MKYSKGTVFHKFRKDYLITEVTDTNVEFICLQKSPSGYNRYVKMDIASFEKASEDTGIWEHVPAELIKMTNTINIEDLFK